MPQTNSKKCDRACARDQRHGFEVFCAEQVFRIKHPIPGGDHYTGPRVPTMDHFAYTQPRTSAY